MGDISYILPDLAAPAAPLTDELVDDAAIAGFLASAREHLGLEIAFIGRWVDGEAREITHVDTALDLPIGPGFRQHREETYCWHILNGTLPELIVDPADYPFTQELHITEALPMGSHLSVPLRFSDGTVWGSFCAMGRSPDPTMNERDLKILRSFATMAADRIETLVSDSVRREETRARIEEMFDGDAVTIFQQPIHSLDEDQPVGIECLARFPDINKRGPGAWFEDAEAAGFGIELEMTAVRGALETLGNIPEHVFASVKAPVRTLLSGAVAQAVHDCEASNLVITLTRHAGVDTMAELEKAIEAIRPLAKIGIDAIGTDFAGLRKLASLRPDFVKLDMALTRGVETDPAAQVMVSAVVELAHSFGAKVIAEGIEEAGEAIAMKRLGVDLGQGYLFARPLPEVAAAQHLAGISA